MQFQADILGVEVERPAVLEVTALGAAALAGLHVGFWQNSDELAEATASERIFTPQLGEVDRERLYAGWRRAVERSLKWADE